MALSQDERSRWFSHSFWPAAKGNFDQVYTWDKSELDWSEAEKNAFKVIYSCISDQTFDESSTTNASLKIIASITYSSAYMGIFNGNSSTDNFTLTEDEIADIIAEVCEECKIYWNDGDTTKYAIDHFARTTLGNALLARDLFMVTPASAAATYKPVSQQSGAAQSQTQTTASQQQSTQAATQQSTTSSATTQATIQQDPNKIKNKWVQKGPMSGEARDLSGKPHEKIIIPNNMPMYKIVDNGNKGKYEIRAFIQSCHKNGEINGTNRVFIGVSRNGGDTTCWFVDKQQAEWFKDEAQDAYVDAKGQQIGKLELEAIRHPDPNGYFELNTQHGKVYVRAKELNEDIEDDEPLEECSNTNQISKEEYMKIMHEASEELNDFLG